MLDPFHLQRANKLSKVLKYESIHLNSWHHSHKKHKDILETHVVLLIFSPELEISGVVVQRIHQMQEMPIENHLGAVLDNFCCYDYGANDSEAVQKINTRTLELHANSLKQLIL